MRPGIRVTANHLPDLQRDMRRAGEEALGQAGENLLEEANRTVPIEEGGLTRSGEVQQDGLTVEVGYNTPYAVVQHERTSYRHDQGRRAKWLQLAFQEQAGQIREWLAREIRRRTG